MRFMACSLTISHSITHGFMLCLHDAKNLGNIVDEKQSIYRSHPACAMTFKYRAD
jgi:hypothetical protein